MKRRRNNARSASARAIAFSALLTIAVAGCRGARTDGDDSPAPAPNPTMLVTTARAGTQPMHRELKILGTTVAMNHVILRAPTAGRVVGVSLKMGDTVRKGQVVARVINREFEAAKAGLAMAQKLDPDNAASLAKSIARHAANNGVAVVATGGGVVSHPPVTNGQVVAELDPLVDLIDPSSVYVEADAPIDELYLFQTGMPAIVTSPLRPGFGFPARVAAVMPSFDAANATSPLRIDFTGDERIPVAGAPVQARVIVSSVPDATVIPLVALFQEAETGRFHVFVAGADGRAHRTEVTIGLRDKDRVQVTSGLKPGDLVITSGGYALSDGLQVSVAQAQQ